jgi:hypothetical protein
MKESALFDKKYEEIITLNNAFKEVIKRQGNTIIKKNEHIAYLESIIEKQKLRRFSSDVVLKNLELLEI